MMSLDERYKILKYISQAEFRTYRELKAFCDFDTFLNESVGRTVTQKISEPDGQVIYAVNDLGRRRIETWEREQQRDKTLGRELRQTRFLACAALGLGLAAVLLVMCGPPRCRCGVRLIRR